jgi:hypothetical protein
MEASAVGAWLLLAGLGTDRGAMGLEGRQRGLRLAACAYLGRLTALPQSAEFKIAPAAPKIVIPAQAGIQ